MSERAENSGVYLRSYLAPLAPWLEREEITDILVNRPGEVWFETNASGLTRVEAPEVTALSLMRLAQQVAAVSSQGVNRAYPLLAATLPDGARVQIVTPPATRGDVALAIRKHVVSDLTIADYELGGALSAARHNDLSAPSDVDVQLRELLAAGETAAFLRQAVRAGKNIVISGGAGVGKTTFLNALLKEAPAQDRLILIEDTPEIRAAQPNMVGLVAVKGALGEARIGAQELLEAALRMRPDRLLVGELRGPEAFTFLRAANTGHAGAMTTVHADSPRGAIEQIAFMALQAGVNLSRADVIAYAHDVLHVIVHLQRANGRRQVSRIAFGASHQVA